mgnify:CR=1 FL=1
MNLHVFTEEPEIMFVFDTNPGYARAVHISDLGERKPFNNLADFIAIERSYDNLTIWKTAHPDLFMITAGEPKRCVDSDSINITALAIVGKKITGKAILCHRKILSRVFSTYDRDAEDPRVKELIHNSTITRR